MSHVIAAPEMMTTAATDLGLRFDAQRGHAAAAAPITAVVASAEDEVSAAIASMFSSHGQQFRALSAQAAAFHDQFVQTLNEAGGRYAATEVAKTASPLADVVQGAQSLAVFSPVKAPDGAPADRQRRQRGPWHRAGRRARRVAARRRRRWRLRRARHRPGRWQWRRFWLLGYGGAGGPPGGPRAAGLLLGTGGAGGEGGGGRSDRRQRMATAATPACSAPAATAATAATPGLGTTPGTPGTGGNGGLLLGPPGNNGLM